MAANKDKQKEWLKNINPDNLCFYVSTVSKKESFGKNKMVWMPFDSDIVDGLDGDDVWDKLHEYSVEWLIIEGVLPTFAKPQDYERSGRAMYRGYQNLSAFHQLAGEVQTGDDFKMTIDEGVFEKIIIPKEFKQKIIEAITQLKEYDLIFKKWGFGEKIKKGKGVNLMFSGASGTGKTYCGEIIADYIGAPYELVSVASIESKWVGESEKNISNIFKSLDKGNKVLILDEVDSFLTSRQSHSQASPHYNKLTNQFLVELERHNGICVMTTNRPIMLDKALQRRIDVVLDFPFPDREARERIWKHHIPDKAPVDKDVDYKKIAEVKLNGGQIKNAILEAARKAALGDKKITEKMLIDSANNELAEANTLLKGKDHS
jgi:SpoVK/Ycf46/Vps4 family AAA+-type ATPase